MDFKSGEILYFNKPLGWTSFKVVGHARYHICRRLGVKKLKVVYSEEEPQPPRGEESTEELPEGRRSLPGSVAFVPSVAGLIIAGEVIKDLIK